MLAFFEIFEAKRAKNGSKNKKKYLVNVFQISILHPTKKIAKILKNHN